MSFRSPKLLRSAKDQPCVICGSVGTTIAAHANWQEFGKGMGIKAHDWAVAYVCQTCHDIIDNRRQGRDFYVSGDRRELWERAWVKTVDIWFREGIVVVK